MDHGASVDRVALSATLHRRIACAVGQVLGLGVFLVFLAAYPVDRWLIARGTGHAAVHGHH